MDEFWLEESSQGSFEAFNDFMRGEPGPYFTPRVDANGNLIWTNNGDLPNPETVNIKGPKGNTGNNGQNGKSAYQQAVEGGYRGSEGSFNDYMANFPSMASAAQAAASQASTAAGQAAASAAHASELVDTLPDDYEDLLQDTAKTIQTVESTTLGPASIVTFDASAADMPLKGLTVNIEPVQNLNGYDKPWPAGGGKNLLKYPYGTGTVTRNGVTFTVYNDGSIKVDTAGAAATANTDLYFFSSTESLPLSNGDYIFSSTYDGTLPSDGFYIHAKANASDASYLNLSIGDEGLYTVSNGVFYTACIRVLSGRTINNVTVRPMLRLATEADATFEPYSNICPISGWTGCKLHRTGVSLIGGDAFLGNAFAKTDSGYELTYGGSGVSQRGSAYADITDLPAGRYTLQFINYTCPDGCTVTFRFRSPEGSWTTLSIIGGSAYGRRSFTMPANAAQIQFYFSPNTASVGDKLTADDVVLMREEDAETPEPYKGNIYNITFPSEAGTVYGGTLDVTTGVLEVKYIKFTFTPDLQYANNSDRANAFSVYVLLPSRAKGQLDMYCNCLKVQESARDAVVPATQISSSLLSVVIAFPKTIVSSFDDVRTKIIELYNSGTPIEIIYQIDQPIIYQLTPQQVTTLLGTNNIWADCGDVTVTYGAYLEMLKASLDRTNSDLANLRACIAPTEDGDTASQAYVRGAYFFRNSSFCVALLEISSGDQFTLGTNYKVASVAEAILAMSFTILEQPVDSKTAVNDMATFTVNARGVQSYQWQYWTPNSTKWNDNTGDVSHQPTFSIQVTTARYNYKYHCKLTSYDGTVIYTNEVKIVQPS